MPPVEELEKLIEEADECYRRQQFPRELELRLMICQIEPENPYYRHNLALALTNNGRYAEALDIFNALAENYPKLSRVHNNRAALLLRLGVDLQYLTPAYILALVNSEDSEDFFRHFINLCGSVAYGLDRNTSEAFDIIEEITTKAIEENFPPEAQDNNVKGIKAFIEAYRDIGLYREALAQKRWRDGEAAINSAKAKLVNIGLGHRADSIEQSVKPYFYLCRDIVEVLEQIGSDKTVSPSFALERYEKLLQAAHSIAENEDPQSFLARVLDVLGWFLTAMVEALRFLSNPLTQYAPTDAPRAMISHLTSASYIDLGQELASLLRFLDRQCCSLYQEIASLADNATILQARDETWARIALFCRGLSLDFRGIDTAVAHSILGWNQEPLEVAKTELQGFKYHIERQSYTDIFVNGQPQENIARALLQAYLKSRNYREVPVRGGRSDILMFTKNGRLLYETKIWRGAGYYQQGLREIEEYVIGEADEQGLLGAFYVLFDPTKSNQAQTQLGNAFSTVTVLNQLVYVVVVNLVPPKPSKKK
jgi:tetratricopeptide (TPR) repeat protein